MNATQTERQPRFSIVSAVYDVARYLPDFISSIEEQTFGTGDVEVIMVDDGSTDDSVAVLRSWAERRPDLVTVLTKENGGQGSARNLGLDHATGEWVTFIDPDDWIIPTYLQTVTDFIDLDDRIMMVGCHRVFFEEPEGRLRDGHPLKKMFTSDQLVNIDRRPSFFHGSAPAAFVRRSVVEQHGIRFDTRIRPNFEDGHFCIRYLLACDEPQIGFLESAQYIYRKRGDGSSTLQSSVAQIGRYRDVPRYGYLDVLERAHRERGAVPLWVQYFILYELSWYFSSEEKPNNSMSVGTGDLGRSFVELLGEISHYLDEAAINSFEVRRYKHEWRSILLHGVRDETWHTPFAVLQQHDPIKQIVRVTYRYSGEPPAERITLSARNKEPFTAKTRNLDYFGQTLLRERVTWVRLDGTLRVELDGDLVELRTSWPEMTTISLSKDQIQAKMTPSRRPGIRTRIQRRQRRWRAGVKRSIAALSSPRRWLTRTAANLRSTVERRILLRLCVADSVRKRYRNAWVLMDRIHDSNDSGEHLFRYLRTERPEINAWFTVEKGTEDWARLRAEGWDHLVPHGSLRWKLLMLNCVDLISSHADVPVVRPPAIVSIRPISWRYTFLNHGVIKDDLSRWLNAKRIDLFVTSTVGEWESIGGNDNNYVLTPREVKLTGMPRFDALEAAKQRVEPAEVNLVLITPTWRYWLNQPLGDGSQRREMVEAFEETEFAQRWLAVLSSDRLREIARAHGCEIGLLPHPNLSAASSLFDAFPDLTRFSFASADLHSVFARTIVNVTDFSSMAFNAAYLERPSVYYQFDQHLIRGGGHVGRAGYFTYEDDGFGPVVFEHDDLLDNIEKILAADGDPGEPYRSRIRDTFPFRDGQCSKRVADEVVKMSKKARQLTNVPDDARPPVDLR